MVKLWKNPKHNVEVITGSLWMVKSMVRQYSKQGYQIQGGIQSYKNSVYESPTFSATMVYVGVAEPEKPKEETKDEKIARLKEELGEKDEKDLEIERLENAVKDKRESEKIKKKKKRQDTFSSLINAVSDPSSLNDNVNKIGEKLKDKIKKL